MRLWLRSSLKSCPAIMELIFYKMLQKHQEPENLGKWSFSVFDQETGWAVGAPRSSPTGFLAWWKRSFSRLNMSSIVAGHDRVMRLWVRPSLKSCPDIMELIFYLFDQETGWAVGTPRSSPTGFLTWFHAFSLFAWLDYFCNFWAFRKLISSILAGHDFHFKYKFHISRARFQ